MPIGGRGGRLDNLIRRAGWWREPLVMLSSLPAGQSQSREHEFMILFTVIGGPIAHEQIENVRRPIDSLLQSLRCLLTAPELTHRSSYEATRCGIIGIVRQISLGRFDGRHVVALEVV